MNVDAEIETRLYWHCQWFKDEKASRGLLLSNSTYPPCCNFHHSWKDAAKIWLHPRKCQETPLALQQKKEMGKETNINADCGLGEGEMAEGERKWLGVASQTFPEVAKQVGEMKPDPRFPRSAFQTVSLPNGENEEFPPNDSKVCLVFLPAPSSCLKQMIKSSPRAAEQAAHCCFPECLRNGQIWFSLPQFLPSVSSVIKCCCLQNKLLESGTTLP